MIRRLKNAAVPVFTTFLALREKYRSHKTPVPVAPLFHCLATHPNAREPADRINPEIQRCVATSDMALGGTIAAPIELSYKPHGEIRAAAKRSFSALYTEQ